MQQSMIAFLLIMKKWGIFSIEKNYGALNRFIYEKYTKKI
jgi:hypothetical protein